MARRKRGAGSRLESGEGFGQGCQSRGALHAVEVEGRRFDAREGPFLELKKPVGRALPAVVPGRGGIQPAFEVVLEGGGVQVADHVAGPPGPALDGEDVDPESPGGLHEGRTAPDEAAVADHARNGVLAEDALEGRAGLGEEVKGALDGSPVGMGLRALLVLLDVEVVGRDGRRELPGEGAVAVAIVEVRAPVVQVHESEIGDARDARPETERGGARHAVQGIHAAYLGAGVDEGGGNAQPPELTGGIHGPLDPGPVAKGGDEHVPADGLALRADGGGPAGEGQAGQHGLGDGLLPDPLGRAPKRPLQAVECAHQASTTVLRAMGSRAAMRPSA